MLDRETVSRRIDDEGFLDHQHCQTPGKSISATSPLGSGLRLYETWPFFVYMMRIGDMLTVVVAVVAARAAVTAGREHWPRHSLFIYFVILVSQIFLKKCKSYEPAALLDLRRQFTLTAKALTWTAVAAFGGSAINGFGELENGQWIYAFLALFLMTLNRLVINNWVSRLLLKGALRQRVVIFGGGERALRMVRHVEAGSSPELAILHLFDDRRDRVFPALISKLAGNTEDLLEYVRREHIDRVLLAIPWTAAHRVNELLEKLRTIPCRIDLCPADVIWDFESADIKRIAGIPLVTIANHHVSPEARIIKWVEDQIIAIILVCAIAPLLLFIACIVKIDSSGPILFKQKRYGYNNRVFDIIKFRTMYHVPATDHALQQATRGDRRVTRFGAFLRRSSLDELPQLFNVLRGEMSLVGPRPHAVAHNLQYAPLIKYYFSRHNYKPGITGLAQISGLRGETDTPDKMSSRVDCDIYYIENWSLWLDIKIILLTPVKILFSRNAY